MSVVILYRHRKEIDWISHLIIFNLLQLSVGFTSCSARTAAVLFNSVYHHTTLSWHQSSLERDLIALKTSLWSHSDSRFIEVTAGVGQAYCREGLKQFVCVYNISVGIYKGWLISLWPKVQEVHVEFNSSSVYTESLKEKKLWRCFYVRQLKIASQHRLKTWTIQSLIKNFWGCPCCMANRGLHRNVHLAGASLTFVLKYSCFMAQTNRRWTLAAGLQHKNTLAHSTMEVHKFLAHNNTVVAPNPTTHLLPATSSCYPNWSSVSGL